MDPESDRVLYNGDMQRQQENKILIEAEVERWVQEALASKGSFLTELWAGDEERRNDLMHSGHRLAKVALDAPHNFILSENASLVAEEIRIETLDVTQCSLHKFTLILYTVVPNQIL